VTKFARYAVRYLNLLIQATGGTRTFGVAWLLVPLGISYYTFSTVGYLLDVYWKRYEYEPAFLRFFLYAIYFPHIVQGPISRYNLLGQELKKELRFDSKRIVFGMELMLWGFFKKLVIADRLNLFVSAVYNGESHPGSVFLVAMLFDAFQIYTDFSGYTDIVRGASQIFGVELEQNFNHPFFSRSVPEYWRRWHMTMGGWFKDYVYYPCTISHFMKSLNKKTKKSMSERGSRFVTVVIPVFITWVLTGLWHGTGKTYVCWGLYYSTLITISTAFQPEFAKLTKLLRIQTDCFSWQLFQRLRTFCCFMGGRVLTSPGGLRNTWMVLKNLVLRFEPWHLVDGSMLDYGIDGPQMVLIGGSLIVLWAVSMMQERFSVREALAKQNIVFRWIIIYAAIFSIILFGIYGIGYDASAFLYTQY
jgi:D-alanyl-lipoteichoic acid acyltransferase DltB (MBOAT superfamily)